MLRLLLVLAAFSGFAQSAWGADFRLLSAWDDRYPAVKLMADAFIEGVDKASQGRIKIRRSGPETVPVTEQLQPVSAGAFHLLFSHGGYHVGTTGVGGALDGVDLDPERRRSAGIWDYVDEHYRRLNLKVIALPTAGRLGYQLITRAPLKTGRFEGLRIRGTLPYHPFIRELGGAPVVLPPIEIYSGLDKGVVDGAIWAMLGALDFKWYEVAKHIARPAFGHSTHIILMNLNAWNTLSDADKKILLEQGQAIEKSVLDVFDKVIAAEEKTLRERGMSETKLSVDQEQANILFYKGVWENALKGGQREAVDKLRQLAKDANLTR